MPGPPIPGHAPRQSVRHTPPSAALHPPDWQDDETVDEYGYDTIIPITFAQYLDRVRARGDIAELARWARWRERQSA